MSALAETMEGTFRAFLQGYIDASKTKDMTRLSTHVTPDCRRYVGPRSFIEMYGVGPDFSMSAGEYEAEFHGMTHYEIVKYEIYNLVIDTQNSKVAARTELFVRFYDGAESSRNHLWFLDLTDDGANITKIYQHNEAEEGRKWREDMDRRASGKSA